MEKQCKINPQTVSKKKTERKRPQQLPTWSQNPPKVLPTGSKSGGAKLGESIFASQVGPRRLPGQVCIDSGSLLPPKTSPPRNKKWQKILCKDHGPRTMIPPPSLSFCYPEFLTLSFLSRAFDPECFTPSFLPRVFYPEFFTARCLPRAF